MLFILTTFEQGLKEMKDDKDNGEGCTKFPVSVLARAKMKIAFGQLELLPCSSSVLVLERPS